MTLAPRRAATGAARLVRSDTADTPPRATTPPNAFTLFFAATGAMAAARHDARTRRGSAATHEAEAMEAMVQDDMMLLCTG